MTYSRILLLTESEICATHWVRWRGRTESTRRLQGQWLKEYTRWRAKRSHLRRTAHSTVAGHTEIAAATCRHVGCTQQQSNSATAATRWHCSAQSAASSTSATATTAAYSTASATTAPTTTATTTTPPTGATTLTRRRLAWRLHRVRRMCRVRSQAAPGYR